MKDLTQGSVIRHLLHMASFLAVSMLVQTLYLLADLYWVGRLGKEAIAAVGVAGNLMMVVLALTQMLGVGTTTLIAQAAGRKDQAHAERAFNQSLVMSIVVALGLGVYLGQAIVRSLASSRPAPYPRPIAISSIIAVLGVGLVAIQVLPTVELTGLSIATDRVFGSSPIPLESTYPTPARFRRIFFLPSSSKRRMAVRRATLPSPMVIFPSISRTVTSPAGGS